MLDNGAVVRARRVRLFGGRLSDIGYSRGFLGGVDGRACSDSARVVGCRLSSFNGAGCGGSFDLGVICCIFRGRRSIRYWGCAARARCVDLRDGYCARAAEAQCAETGERKEVYWNTDAAEEVPAESSNLAKKLLSSKQREPWQTRTPFEFANCWSDCRRRHKNSADCQTRVCRYSTYQWRGPRRIKPIQRR